MQLGIAAFIGLYLVAGAGGSACAMNSEPAATVHCVVEGGEKLPPDTGGATAVCAVIANELKTQTGGVAVQVRVEVKSGSWLVARITRDGVDLPDQNMAVSDGRLRKSSIDRFARAIAQAVAAAR